MVGLVIAAVGLVIASGVSFYVTRQAAAGHVEVNEVMGIRTKLTKSSQAAWLLGHQAALPAMGSMVRWTAVLAVASVVAGVVAQSDGLHIAVPVVAIIAGYAVLTWYMVVGVRAAHRAIRAMPDAPA